jgi:transposase
VLRRISKRRTLSTAVALTLSGRIYKRHFDHAIHGADFVIFLRHLQRWLPGPLLVIWDRLQVHRSAEVKSYLGHHPEIMVEMLPSYAPDLNPEEGCHGDVKQHLLNATPEDTRQIRQQADRGFARLRHRPDLILGFFHHAGFRVKRLT